MICSKILIDQFNTVRYSKDIAHSFALLEHNDARLKGFLFGLAIAEGISNSEYSRLLTLAHNCWMFRFNEIPLFTRAAA